MMNIKLPSISERLELAASFVRSNSKLADIGTDHAHLPIYLIKRGRISSAIAADIAEGPLARAEQNVRLHGLSGNIKTVLSDGLKNVMEHNPNDITICGMGGETIMQIISDCPAVKDPSIRLICQPQSVIPEFREFILREGFNIIDEGLCHDRGKFYVCICAEFDGICREYSPVQLVLGQKNIEKSDKILSEYAKHVYNVLKKKRDGLKSANLPYSEIDALMSDVYNYI